MNTLPIVIIGAGPIGLAAASRLLERGETPLVLEAAQEAGAAIKQWGHVRMFSSWAMNVDLSSAALLQASGWTMPSPEAFPTGQELVEEYIAPLAKLPALAQCIRYGQRVLAVTRQGMDKLKLPGREAVPFELRVRLSDGSEKIVQARAVIDASGTWATPNPAGSSGLAAVGEAGNPHVTYGIPDVLQGQSATPSSMHSSMHSSAPSSRYAGRDTAVLGSGHSAINVLLDLVQLRQQTGKGRVTWVTRGTIPSLTKTDSTVSALLPERGSALQQAVALVRTGAIQVFNNFGLDEITTIPSGRLLLRGRRKGDRSMLEADEIVVCTGCRPDLEMLRELHLSVDPWLESAAGVGQLIRAAAEKGEGIPQPYGAAALSHPERNFFVVGMKSHGRAPNFFLSYGYEQVRSVAAWLCGDIEAASRVEFQLPSGAACNGCGDGACCASVGGAQTCGGGAGGCCGPATQSGASSGAAATCGAGCG